ncbi:uncharacterized protein ALTATR162_LOCUS3657 [Alternaria atra]|uniref:Regulator of chromosome condensation 1/beta-lactamase-inhibitor protein II n=1 Tax=Alternaria atra TaxID=119953 RepID=A0A8J2MYJ1_9PLEO|nr:uncharacterized protein ALTATR162_LOCUS3657 [Alternaria atra]CAG5155427.1 unnamed protein product [Alternaria atra]
MRLYAFGLKHDTDRPVPVPILQAPSIRVLWAAWCDAVIAYSNNGDEDGGGRGGGEEPWPWVLKYVGTGLTAAQKKWLTEDGHLKRVSGLGEVVFFGSAMHDGLRGYIVKSGDRDAECADQRVVLFGTDMEVEDGVPDVQAYSLSENDTTSIITDVKIDSEGVVLLYMKSRSTVEESVVHFADFRQFQRYFSSGLAPSSPAPEVTPLPYESHSPPQCVINATTTTAVDDGMHVWTSTRDPRYPRCLGRPYNASSETDIAPLSYLEESYVTKIASGGYMSAAVSSDGEFFLWGQACPGSEGELDVLNGSIGADGLATGIGVDEEQDEFLKCLDVRIEGKGARVCDVAIGHGHVLVAAEVCGIGEETKRVLFAAGDNGRTQLGPETGTHFKERFEEVKSMRGKRIIQLVAAGWSSYIVSDEE